MHDASVTDLSCFDGQRILVTGGAGYLAYNLVRILRDVNCSMVLLDRPGASFSVAEGMDRVETVFADIRERMVWERTLENVDIVFHFAAQTSAYVADENPVTDVGINVMPLLNLLETCRQRGWRPVVLFASTATICGIPKQMPVNESHPANPLTVYDLHKLMAEQYLKWYISKHGVRGAVLRLANVYGPGPKSSQPDRGVLNQMIRRAVAGESLTVYGSGQHLRDYVYVEDVARAFLLAARNVGVINGEHLLVGSGCGYTICQAMDMVAERTALKMGRRVVIEHVDPPHPQSPIDARDFVADSSRLAGVTGWQATCGLSAGIDQTIDSFM